VKLEITEFDDFFLECSWYWLNDPEVQFLTNTPSFSKESQIKWYNNLRYSTSYKIWGLRSVNKSIGVCGLKNISNEGCEYWGYIGDKNYWGLGLGIQIVDLMIEEAKKIGIHELWLKVIIENSRAIALYQKCGFKKFKEEFGVIYMIKHI
jgi:RimJ/RimL family protein N-acetyltransferase